MDREYMNNILAQTKSKRTVHQELVDVYREEILERSQSQYSVFIKLTNLLDIWLIVEPSHPG